MNRSRLAILALLATSGSAVAQSFTYPDFSSTSGLTLVGRAAQAGTILRLQDNVAPPVGADNRGAAWYSTPVCVANGFDTTFTYRMHTPSTTGGSEGLCLVIQNDQLAGSAGGTGNTSIGQHASAIGYGQFVGAAAGTSIDNSLAIELDTYLGTVQSDPDSNHISVHTNGTGENNAFESYSIGRAPNATLGTDLNNAAVHTIRVVYVPGTLEVYLDGVLKLTTPYNFATGGTWLAGGAVGGLSLIGGTSAFVGFTSGAGSAREFRDVQSWSWTSTCAPVFTSYCFGDGTATACPCGNAGTAGNGCANSTNAAGGNLAASGTASIASDSLVLSGSGMPNSSALYFQGTTQQSAGLGVMFGDGLRCAGGSVIRLDTKANAAGASQYPAAGDSSVSVRGLVTAAGTRTYQVWYRNADPTFCTPSTFNLTNGIEVVWN